MYNYLKGIKFCDSRIFWKQIFSRVIKFRESVWLIYFACTKIRDFLNLGIFKKGSRTRNWVIDWRKNSYIESLFIYFLFQYDKLTIKTLLEPVCEIRDFLIFLRVFNFANFLYIERFRAYLISQIFQKNSRN